MSSSDTGSDPSTLSVFYDPVFLEHRPPDGAFDHPPDDRLAVSEPHPDRPERIENIRRMIERELADHTTWRSVTPASRDQLERVHDPAYLDSLRDLAAQGGGRLIATTAVSERTYDAAEHAAGAAFEAARYAHEYGLGEVPYALVRPSGHHAQPAQADGYCYVNNVAVAAAGLIAIGRARRVAIVDWDVHPANGTQECFYDRDDVLAVSLHNDYGAWGPNHPQENSLTEVGDGTGEGYTVNVPLPPGTGDGGYTEAFERVVKPVVAEFDPGCLLVSAGQDPGQVDPNGRNLVTMAGFRDLGRRVREIAARSDAGLALVQEGGYGISSLAYDTLGVLCGATGIETDARDPFDLLAEYRPPASKWIEDAVEAHDQFWSIEG